MVGHSASLNHDAEIVSLQGKPGRQAEVGCDTKPLDCVVAALRDLPARSLFLKLLILVSSRHLQCDDPVLEAVEPINQIIEPEEVKQGSRDTPGHELSVFCSERAILLEPNKQHELACP